MKKLAYTAGIILASTSLTFFSACGSGDGKDSKDSTAVVKPATEKVKDEGFKSSINIRYVDDTLLMQKYEYAKVTLEQCQKIAYELQNYQNSLGQKLEQKKQGYEQQLNQRAAAIDQKQKSNGYLTEASLNADVQELQKLQSSWAQELQKLDQASQNQYISRAKVDKKKINDLTQSVTDAIENYITRYNKEKKYDAILFKTAGLYFNPALDITDEIAEGLNAEYKAKNGKDAK